MSRLTVKALRFYHEQGLLEPVRVDEETGYRYYDEQSLQAAHAIAWLRGMDFAIAEIRELFAGRPQEDGDLTRLFSRKAQEIAHRGVST